MAASTPSPPPSASAATRDARANATGSSRAREATVGDDDANSPQMKQLLASVLKDRTAEGGAVAKTVSSVPGDTCTWYANKQCSVARTCFDCLNTRLAGDTQICMVDTFGVCVSMSQYKNEKDFRRTRPANAMGSTSNQYPSTNATYCATNDQYCALCRNNWNNPFDNSQLSYLPFCRGMGGCVCVQACESPYHNDNVIMQRCIAYGYSAPSATTIYTSIGFMAALCCVVALVTCFVRRWLARTRANTRPAFRHDSRLRQREPTGPQLGLSGWRSMREKLIETEREHLEQTGDPHVLGLQQSVEPTTATVETGHGYVPVSPTHSPSRPHHPVALEHSEEGDEEEEESSSTMQRRRRASSEPTTRTEPEPELATRQVVSGANEL